VLTIGATNLAEELDQALLRPGRFEVCGLWVVGCGFKRGCGLLRCKWGCACVRVYALSVCVVVWMGGQVCAYLCIHQLELTVCDLLALAVIYLHTRSTHAHTKLTHAHTHTHA
jgi:hypothetical protein